MLDEPTILSSEIWQNDLRRGERILWTGESHPEFGPDLFFGPILVGGVLVMAGFLILLLKGNLTLTTVMQCLLVAVPTFGGIALVRYLAGRYVHIQTFYAVTNQRVRFRGGINKVQRDLDLRSLPEMRLQVRAKGRGRIIFRESERNDSKFGNGALLILMDGFDPSFDNIENVGGVYELIQRAQTELK